MDPQLVDQLHNADPAVRRKAIIALGRSKDLTALSELAQVYRADPVPELRELARQAGRYIQQENRPAPEPVASPPDAELEPAPLDAISSPVTPAVPAMTPAPMPAPAITPADVQRGAAYFRSARSLSESGEQARAIKELALALHADPGLANEPVFITLASEVLGAPPRAAIRTLLDPERRQAAFRAAVAARRRVIRQRGCALGPVLAALALFLALGALALTVWWIVDGDAIDSVRHRYTVWRLTEDERSLPGGRTYYLYEPSGVIPAGGWAVIVALHGGGATGEDMLTPELIDLADDERALLVAPNLDMASALSGAPDSRAGALEGLSEIVAHVREAYAVSAEGVALYGYDQGARLATAFLAAHPEQVYAAVAESPSGIFVPEPREGEGVPVPPLTLVFSASDTLAETTQPEIDALRAQGHTVEVVLVEGEARQMTEDGRRALRRILDAIRAA